MITVASERGILVYANPMAEAITGYGQKELIGKSLGDIVHPGDLKDVTREGFFWEAEATGAKSILLRPGKRSDDSRPSQRREFRIITKRSDVKWVEVNAALIEWNNRPAVLQFSTDITERKRAAEISSRLAAIVEGSDDAIIGKTLDGIITSWNNGAEKLYGYSADEMVGKPISILIPPNRPEELKQILDQVRRGEPVRHYETQRLRKHGAMIFVSLTVSPIKDSTGGIVGASTITRDITERKRMENELREHSEHLEELVEERAGELKRSEEKFRRIAERSIDEIFEVDLDGKIVYSSQAEESILGYKPGETDRSFALDIFAESERPKIRATMEKLRNGEIIRHLETEAIRKNGAHVPVEINAAPIISDNLEVLGAQGIIRDISERKRLELLREQFISAVTHELRTPLISVKGYVDYILTGELGPLPERVESSLKIVKQEAEKLHSLVNDLLDIRRLESGRFGLNVDSINLRDIIDQSIKEVRFMVEIRKQKLHLEAPESPMPIQGDPVRLSQALVNLLSNAIKFSPEGSEINVRVNEMEDVVQVKVSDQGLGIRKEDLQHVFEPFASINKPSYIKGTGLGLSLTKGLVEAHGGRIWAESPGEGKGATLTFTLPKRKKVD